MNVSACRSVPEALQTAAAEKAAPGLMAVTERVLVVVAPLFMKCILAIALVSMCTSSIVAVSKFGLTGTLSVRAANFQADSVNLIDPLISFTFSTAGTTESAAPQAPVAEPTRIYVSAYPCM